MSETPVILYQIGNMPIHMHEQLWNSDSFKSDGKAVDLPGSYKTLWPDLQFQPAMRTTQITGILLGTCGLTPSRILQHLKRMVGHPVPIIGWYDDGCCGSGCPCECSTTGCVAVWVENYGIIRAVNVTSNKSQNDTAASITIDVEMGSYWQPLSRIQWEWSNAFTANPSEYPCLTDPFIDPDPPWGVVLPHVERDDYWKYLAPYPRCDMLYRNCKCEGFAYRGYGEFTMLNPKLWPYTVGFHSTGYPMTGIAGSAGVAGATARVEDVNEFIVDVGRWGAPPLSWYAFTQIVNPQGFISIRVECPSGLWAKQVMWTKLNVSTLNQSMIDGGWGPLLPTDTIIIGDLDRMPGLVMRDKRILPGIRPLPVFEGQWPGYIEPGRVQVAVIMTAGGFYSYKHEWRRL